MSVLPCSEHPGSPAVFTCDGCARMLCAACTKEGHRLIFCLHCGERALPLDVRASANVPERQRQAKIQKRYTLDEALRYVFRGHGRLILPGYIVGMTLADTLPGFGDAIGWFFLLLLPGLLFAIVNTTADGDDTLPDWPDYTDPFGRIVEGLWLLLIVVVSCLPAFLFFRLSGCELELFLAGEGGASCWAPLVGGVVLGSVLGIFAFGATAYNSSGWLSFRIDLHLRALTTPARADALKTAGILSLFFVVSQVVAMVLRPVPVLGALAEHSLSGYALFTGAHLVGLIFRRHSDELNLVYRS